MRPFLHELNLELIVYSFKKFIRIYYFLFAFMKQHYSEDIAH